MGDLTPKPGDGALPKPVSGMIRLHDANLPGPRKLPPDFVRDFASNSTTPVTAEDKELRHIPNRSTAGDLRPSLYQGEPYECPIHPDKQRVTAWLMPVERKIRVAESSVRTQFHLSKLAEVMYVQLEQVGQNRLLLGEGGHDFEIWP